MWNRIWAGRLCNKKPVIIWKFLKRLFFCSKLGQRWSDEGGNRVWWAQGPWRGPVHKKKSRDIFFLLLKKRCTLSVKIKSSDSNFIPIQILLRAGANWNWIVGKNLVCLYIVIHFFSCNSHLYYMIQPLKKVHYYFTCILLESHILDLLHKWQRSKEDINICIIQDPKPCFFCCILRVQLSLDTCSGIRRAKTPWW